MLSSGRNVFNIRRIFMNKIPLRTFALLLSILLLTSSCSLPRIIIVKDPLSPEEHINLGVAYEKKGELDNALLEYKKAAKKLSIALYYLGNIYFQKKEFEKAEKAYRKSIKKNPQHADSYNNLAWLYYTTQKNLSEAEELVKKAITLNPSKTNFYEDTLRSIRDLEKSRERT